MKAALNLEQLKALLHTHTQKEYLICPSVLNGIPRGAISEISGNGKTQFVANLLVEHQDLKVAWIEDKFSINPFGLQQNKIKPDKIVFVEAGEHIEWAALQALRSQIFPVVVLYGEFRNIKALRRIQMATEKANAVTLWLTPEPQSFWTSSMQIQVLRRARGSETEIRILRQK